MLLSVVIPCYNEEQVLNELYRRLTMAAKSRFGNSYELIFVDDGSHDRTWEIIRELSEDDYHVVAIRLARNHGHQHALTAGLSAICGELVLVIDADLQDPPELLGAMHETMIREQADVVFGKRRSRAGETHWKRKSAAAFYRLLKGITHVEIPIDTGDFRLMTRRIADHIVQMREQDRFIRGMVAWLGHKQVAYEYDRNERFAGVTKYPQQRMIAFAVDALLSFSIVPLRLATYFGAILIVALIFIGLYALLYWAFFGIVPGWRGWTSLTLIVVLASATQLLVLGIIGEYVGRIYIQSKQRPLFIICELHRSNRAKIESHFNNPERPNGGEEEPRARNWVRASGSS